MISILVKETNNIESEKIKHPNMWILEGGKCSEGNEQGMGFEYTWNLIRENLANKGKMNVTGDQMKQSVE